MRMEYFKIGWWLTVELRFTKKGPDQALKMNADPNPDPG
jgi:hypothetical protein